MYTITNFLNSYQSCFSYVNLLNAVDLTAAGSAYELPGSISATNIISVASFGALGDGTDQTSAIQAALNGGSGKTVYFPAGTYVVSSALTIPANTRLLGDSVLQNTVIKASSSLPAGSVLFTSSGNNIYIEKIVIDGNNNQNRTIALLSFFNVRYVYLIQSVVQNTSHMGMAAGGCLDVRVWGCKFENCGRPTYSSAIGSTPAFWTDTSNSIISKDVYLEKNLFLNNNWSAAYLMPTGGIFKDNLLVNNGESGVFSNQNAKYVVYQNNYIYGQVRKNISASGLEIGGAYHSIINNVIHGCGNDGISLNDTSYSLVEYNTTYDNGVENSYPAFALAAGISIYSLSNSAATALYNTIKNNRSYNSPSNQTQQIGLLAYKAPGATTIDYNNILDNANYNNVQYQFRDHLNSSIGYTTNLGDNLVNPNSLNVGHQFISTTVQNIFNASIVSFIISSSPSTGVPGDVISYTVICTKPNGIKLYLKEIGSATATNFEWTEKSIIINGNTATFTRTVGPLTGPTVSNLALKEGSFSGITRASITVNLNATNNSSNPGPAKLGYSIFPSIITLGESRSVTFTVVTTGVSTGTIMYYKIVGPSISAADFNTGSLTGSVTIQNNGIGQFTLTLLSDNVNDDKEEFIVELYNSNSYSTKVASTYGSVTMYARDNNAAYNLQTSGNQFNEQNQTVTFTLAATNIPPGARIPYTITGISSSDLAGNPNLSGYFTLKKPLATAERVFTGLFSKSQYNGSQYLNWGLYRSTLGYNPDQSWSSSGISEISDIVELNATGEGVDIVILDGGILNPAHPEFAVNNDGTGGSRVQYYNWYQHASALGDTDNIGQTYTSVPGTNSSSQHAHHVAGIAAGNSQGWAVKSRIYNFYAIGDHRFGYIKEFHKAKKAAGITRPTIVNFSIGYWLYVPISQITRIDYQGTSVYRNPPATSFTSVELENYGLFTPDGVYVYAPTTYSPIEVQHINDCLNEGIILINSAGNNSAYMARDSTDINWNNKVYYPTIPTGTFYARGDFEQISNVISVGAIGADTSGSGLDGIVNFTNRGPRVDIFAPGQNIQSSWIGSNNPFGGQYPIRDSRNPNFYQQKLSGTSMAAPQVTGLSALLLQKNPTLTQSSLLSLLVSNAGLSQIPTSSGGITDLYDLLGAPNRYLKVPNSIKDKTSVDKSNFLELGGWNAYLDRTVGIDTGLTLIIRGKEVSFSDEPFWNPNAPKTSAQLLRISNTLKGQGYRTGIVVMPYVLTHSYVNGAVQETPAVTETQLLNIISTAGLDFVGLDPYLWEDANQVRILNGSLYWTPARLISWTTGFINQLKTLGVATKIVLQGFRHTSQNVTEVNNYNNSLLALSNVEEFINFGYEDAGDLIAATAYYLSQNIQNYFVTLNNDFPPQTYYDSIAFTTSPDSSTEGTETATLTISGPAEYIIDTALPLNTAAGVLSASFNILDSSTGASPSYTLTRSNATVNEGQSVTITLTTSNVANGTSIPWTVTGISAGDLSSGSLTGNFVVGSVTTASFTFSNDILTEGPETFTLSLNNGAASIFVTVEDTSTAPVVTYSLTNNTTDNKINEGQVVTFTLTTTNVPNGTSIPWDIVGVNADDLLLSFVVGNFIVGSVNTATFTLKNDQVPEGTERLTLRAYYPTVNQNTIVASSYVDVIDTSVSAGAPGYVLTNNASIPANEGDVITFLLTTTNVSTGTIVPWQILGLGAAGSATSANDFLSDTEGSFLIDGNGQGTSAIGIKSDLKTENIESFRFRLKNNIAIYNDISIADTSSSLSVYTLTTNLSPVSEGQDLLIYLTQTPYDASENTQSYVVTGITSADLDLTLGAPSTGSFNLTDVGGVGLASLSFRIKADTLTEGSENFILTLNGIGRSESITIGVTDSSTTPGVSYTLNSTTNTVNEGGTVIFHLSTTGVGALQNVPYTVSGISLADLSLGTLTGNFTTNAVGGGSVTFVIDNDFKAEGTETLTLSLNNGQASKSVSIIDTSVPSYSLSSAGIVNEGDSITITITGAGTQSGDVVPYFITGLSASDLDSTSLYGLTGNFTINPTGSTPNQGTITLKLANDLLTEGPETFDVNIGTVNLIYTSHSIIVTDTSLTPPTFPGYNLQVLDYVVDEGDSLTFVLYTTNIPATTNIPYTITGITAADLLSGSITGNFVAGSYATDEARLTITLKEDTLTEGPETLRLAIDGTNQYVDVVVRDTSLTPSPTTPTYSLSVTPSSLYEGSSVFVLLSVTNLGAGVNVPYIITGVSSSDIDQPLSGGTFVVNSAGKASITINATSDLLTEGTEYLTLTLRPISGSSSSVIIPIVDTSTSFPSYNLSANASIYNEGDTAYILLTTTGLPANTSIPYTIFGVGSNDINNASVTGNFVTNVLGFANLTLTLTPDGVLEAPQEFLNVTLNANSQVFVTVFVNDTSKPAISYKLTSNTSVASENSTVSITLNTTGIFQNTLIPYVIGGTIGEDDYTLDATGNFVIDPLGNSIITVTILKDYILENTEIFFLYLQDNPQTNVTIYVNDFSYSTTVPLDFVDYVPPPPPIATPPPGFNVTEISSLGDALDRPSTLVQNLIPEFSRGG